MLIIYLFNYHIA